MRRKFFALALFVCAFPGLAEDATAARRVVLADVPLAELAKTEADFATAQEAMQAGDKATARNELFAVASSRDTHVQLLAWNALRALGVQPDADEAWIVRGVVVEQDGGEGATAVGVYEDGVVRWLDAEGNVHESSGVDRETVRLARTMRSSGEQIVKAARPMPHADGSPLTKGRVRVTVLTWAGFYVVEKHRSSLTEQDAVSAPLQAATRILQLVGE